jgi:hypothetical protein
MTGSSLEVISVRIEKSEVSPGWFVSADYGFFRKDRTVVSSETISGGVDRCLRDAAEWIKLHEGALDNI